MKLDSAFIPPLIFNASARKSLQMRSPAAIEGFWLNSGWGNKVKYLQPRVSTQEHPSFVYNFAFRAFTQTRRFASGCKNKRVSCCKANARVDSSPALKIRVSERGEGTRRTILSRKSIAARSSMTLQASRATFSCLTVVYRLGSLFLSFRTAQTSCDL